MQSQVLIVLASAITALAGVLPRAADSFYPADVIVTKYPNGLPDFLKPVIPANNTGVAVKRDEDSLQKRGVQGGVYLCTDANFQGTCAHIVAPEWTCVNLGPDLSDKVSSVGPDQGANGQKDTCTFFSNYDCLTSEGQFAAQYPGFSDLSANSPPGPYWNDRISSYSCRP